MKILLKNNRAQLAAMFGIDARIALVIFAVVATISGSYGYSVYNDLNYGRILYESKTLGKAIDRYQNDVGANIIDTYPSSETPENKEKLFLKLLSEKKYVAPLYQRNWKGPYLSKHYDSEKKDLFLDSTYKIVKSKVNMAENCSFGVGLCYSFLKFDNISKRHCDGFEKAAISAGTTVLRSQVDPCDIYIQLTVHN